jgi:hypothetical protein
MSAFKRGAKRSGASVPARRQNPPNDRQPERATPDDLANRYAFRRNRTITGSSSANIASSNELNAEVRSPRAHVHHLTSLRRRLMFYFSIVAVSSFLLYLLLGQMTASVSVQMAGINVLPNDDTAAYQKVLDSYYAAKPTERLRFLLDQKALLSHTQALRPEIKAVDVLPGASLGESAVNLTARKPIARWSIDGVNQYVDGDGIVFDRNYFADPGLQIIDESGLQTSNSRLVASNRFLGFIGRVIALSANNGLPVTKVTIPALTTRQIALTISGKATIYKLSVDRSAGQQVEDIVHINKYMAANNLTPGYVDVRVQGKAFYK